MPLKANCPKPCLPSEIHDSEGQCPFHRGTLTPNNTHNLLFITQYISTYKHNVPKIPSQLECTLDEGRHKTNGQRTEGMICPQGMVLFLIDYPDQKKKITFASFAPLRFKNKINSYEKRRLDFSAIMIYVYIYHS